MPPPGVVEAVLIDEGQTVRKGSSSSALTPVMCRHGLTPPPVSGMACSISW